MNHKLVIVTLLLASCGSSSTPVLTPTVPTPVEPAVVQAPAVAVPVPVVALTMKMAEFTANGYELSGAEYWPYVGTVDINYPDEVLWGFYPEKGVLANGETTPNVGTSSPAAVACAARAYAELQAFIASDQPMLRNLAADAAGAGYDNKFYLWTNDYSRAADPYPPGVRPAKLWYWKRREPKPDRPPGFWKWESTLDQKGVCHTPDVKVADEYLRTAVREVELLTKLAKSCRGSALDGTKLTETCRNRAGAPAVKPEFVELGGATVGMVRSGKKFAVKLVIKNARALPLLVNWGELQSPVLTLADGNPLPGAERCGVGYGSGGGATPVFALEGGGSVSFSTSAVAAYVGCDGKRRVLAPGAYQAHWQTTVGEFVIAVKVVK